MRNKSNLIVPRLFCNFFSRGTNKIEIIFFLLVFFTESYAGPRLFDFEARSDASGFVRDAVYLRLDFNEVSKILKERKDAVEISIPLSENNSFELELKRVTVTGKDFSLRTTNGRTDFTPENLMLYRGTVRGREKTIASLSVCGEFVTGIISVEEGNYVLGPVGTRTRANNNYILYNDRQMLVRNNFTCGVTDGNKFVLKRTRPLKRTGKDMTSDTVRISFIADYQMYLDNNSDPNQVGLFIISMFQHVATLYRNESIPVGISEILVYTIPDPYISYHQSDDILFAFGADTQDNFYGDIAELLSTRDEGLGGIAWINVLCQSYNPADQSGRFAFCNIDNNYQPYPTYSWTVEVVTHENGHNFGSQHTHACVWPVLSGGRLGAIDSCYYAEGNCFQFPVANNNGTIMSYCHLNGAINFLYGFGPLPGDTIREGYSLAACIDSSLNSSEQPVTFSLSQNYPNPFNPVTAIRFSIPEDGNVNLRIIDITGRETVTLIPDQFRTKGIYSYTFNSAGYPLASGIYFYKIDFKSSSAEYSEAKKMVLLK